MRGFGALRRHARHRRRDARARRDRRGRRRRRPHQGVGLGGLTRARGADRLPQRGHAHPPALGPPRRPGRPVRARPGTSRSPRRPLERVAEPLREMGAHVETTDGHAPIVIGGDRLHPIRYELPVASAQVKSAILLAGIQAGDGPTIVVEPQPDARPHRADARGRRRARRRARPRDLASGRAERLEPLDLEMPGDFSSAAPFIVAATLLSGSDLRLHGIGINPTRTGLLERARPDGRARLALQPPHRRRRAGRRHRGRARPSSTATRHRGRTRCRSWSTSCRSSRSSPALARGESTVRGAGRAARRRRPTGSRP